MYVMRLTSSLHTRPPASSLLSPSPCLFPGYGANSSRLLLYLQSASAAVKLWMKLTWQGTELHNPPPQPHHHTTSTSSSHLLSSHLDPSGFIILCEDHLAVSKPCPATWELILIFIREGLFWGWEWGCWGWGDRWCKNRERDREKRACGDGRGSDEESTCGHFLKVRHEGCESWHIEDDAAICFRQMAVNKCFLAFVFRGRGLVG